MLVGKDELFLALLGVAVAVFVKVIVDSVVGSRQSLDNLRVYVEQVEREFIAYTSKPVDENAGL